MFQLVSQKRRPLILLLGSLVFYGVLDPKILLLLTGTVYINHALTPFLSPDSGHSSRIRTRVHLLLVSLNLGFLIFFKYFLFLITTGLWILGPFVTGLPTGDDLPGILLPVGISFYTFQLISYITDLKRGRIGPMSSFRQLLLYTLYFPQLVAGPIERAEHLGPLLENPPGPDRAMIREGTFLFLEGLYKKLAVADLLSPVVDASLLPGAAPLPWGQGLTGILFAIQIYADFSGYTDMARGISLWFGIPLTENFYLPFFSRNPAEIWRRWHATLMSFLRDYIYVPLGGSGGSLMFTFRNILIVFTLGGLWHGASFGHMSWGIYSGLLVILAHGFRQGVRLPDTGPFAWMVRGAGIFFTFLSFALGTLLIRIHSLDHFVQVFSNLWPTRNAFVPPWFLHAFLVILPLTAMDLFRFRHGGSATYRVLPGGVRPFVALFWILAVILYGAPEGQEFIYFQF